MPYSDGEPRTKLHFIRAGYHEGWSGYDVLGIRPGGLGYGYLGSVVQHYQGGTWTAYDIMGRRVAERGLRRDAADELRDWNPSRGALDVTF